jgi:hypothetical protein
MGSDNVLVVRVDCTEPDGWWYDGGGIYRNVWFTAIESPGPVIAPFGLYVGGSKPTGSIAWDSAGNPSADAILMPMVEIWNNGSATSAFSLTVTVKDSAGKIVGTSSGTGSSGAGDVINWAPKTAITMTKAAVWHPVNPPNTPALYTATAVRYAFFDRDLHSKMPLISTPARLKLLHACVQWHFSRASTFLPVDTVICVQTLKELTVGGVVVDSVTETFGVRRTFWDAEKGFILNDKPFKILGNARCSSLSSSQPSLATNGQTIQDLWQRAVLFPLAANPP